MKLIKSFLRANNDRNANKVHVWRYFTHQHPSIPCYFSRFDWISKNRIWWVMFISFHQILFPISCINSNIWIYWEIWYAFLCCSIFAVSLCFLMEWRVSLLRCSEQTGTLEDGLLVCHKTKIRHSACLSPVARLQPKAAYIEAWNIY